MKPDGALSSVAARLRDGGFAARWRDRRWPRGRARAVVLALAALAVVGCGVLAWQWSRLHGRAQVGAAFGARIGCGCRYVEGRPLDQCAQDLEPGMGMITLSEDAATKTITARFPLLARQSATWHAGAGCVLEKWAD